MSKKLKTTLNSPASSEETDQKAPQKKRGRFARLGALVVLSVLTYGGCGDDETPTDPNAIVCNSSQALKSVGEVGEVDGAYATKTLDGLLGSREIRLSLGEVDFMPAGTDEIDTRSRLLVFTGNQSSPSGRGLQTMIDLRISELGDDGRTFQIVDRGLNELCDVANGEICVRFGLDDTNNDELREDNVVHLGKSGTITFTELTATTLSAEWSITFGPNINRAFDDSSGMLDGCFSSVLGQGSADGDALTSP